MQAGQKFAPPLLDDVFVSFSQTGEEMDRLWSEGWRHFGPLFFRSSYSQATGSLLAVQPLRVLLEQFRPRKSHRRLLRKNADVKVEIGPVQLDDRRSRLFDRHKTRFQINVPQQLEDFVGPHSTLYPCKSVEVSAWLSGELVAASYLDLGKLAASSVYAIFDPPHSGRGLGIATMLWEMAYARSRGCRLYYPGYAHHEPSSMDYKKQFAPMEWFDWQGRWRPLADQANP